MDKSKGSLFIKLIAIVQVMWNMFQVATRLANGLSIVQLEVAVLAFSWCAIITYAGLLEKPQGVGVPLRPVICGPKSLYVIQSDVHNRKSSSRTVISHYNLMVTTTLQDYLPKWLTRDTLSDFDWTYVPNDTLASQLSGSVERRFTGWAFGGVVFGGVVFGGVHCAGQNLHFKTEIEQTLWRSSSVFITVSLLIWAAGAVLFSKRFLNSRRLLRGWDLLFVVCYIIARVILLMEYFRGLFHPRHIYLLGHPTYLMLVRRCQFTPCWMNFGSTVSPFLPLIFTC